MSSVHSQIINNLKQHHSKWVSVFCAIGNLPLRESNKALNELVRNRIIERKFELGLLFYRYAPLPTTLKVIK